MSDITESENLCAQYPYPDTCQSYRSLLTLMQYVSRSFTKLTENAEKLYHNIHRLQDHNWTNDMEQKYAAVLSSTIAIFTSFKIDVQTKVSILSDDLRIINDYRSAFYRALFYYQSMLSSQSASLGVYVLQDILNETQQETENYRQQHNDKVTEYNNKIMAMQFLLTHFRSGLIVKHQEFPPLNNENREIIPLYKYVQELSKYFAVIGETEDEIIQRNASLMTWKEDPIGRISADYVLLAHINPTVESQPQPLIQQPQSLIQQPQSLIQQPQPLIHESHPIIQETPPVIQESHRLIEEPQLPIEEPLSPLTETISPIRQEQVPSISFPSSPRVDENLEQQKSSYRRAQIKNRKSIKIISDTYELLHKRVKSFLRSHNFQSLYESINSKMETIKSLENQLTRHPDLGRLRLEDAEQRAAKEAERSGDRTVQRRGQYKERISLTNVWEKVKILMAKLKKLKHILTKYYKEIDNNRKAAQKLSQLMTQVREETGSLDELFEKERNFKEKILVLKTKMTEFNKKTAELINSISRKELIMKRLIEKLDRRIMKRERELRKKLGRLNSGRA